MSFFGYEDVSVHNVLRFLGDDIYYFFEIIFCMTLSLALLLLGLT